MTDTAWIAVTVAQTKGSAPRDAGTRMTVFKDSQTGTIGGGALEWEATLIARQMLADGRTQFKRTFPLGPDLGQCCGGSVALEFQRDVAENTPAGTALWIWGAGHVGRAIAGIMAPFDEHTVTLIDISADRLRDPMPNRVAPLVATDPLKAVQHAPLSANHLIVTYSHDLDLALCDALLRRGFRSAGLIGSATKWERFRRRLHAMGHSDTEISRITCPIGDPSLGKHPQAIAIGVASALL